MKTIKIFIIAVLLVVGYSASAQWTENGSYVYYPGTKLVGIGTSTPAATLNVVGTAAGAWLRVESPYSGTAVTPHDIADIILRNSTTNDKAFIGLRKNGNTHDFVQSIYDASNSAWREFIYFNVGTQKYEMKNGVKDAEFQNTGNVIFNNGGGVVIGNTTVPSGVKLAVDGKITSTEVEVTLNAWPDYVFNEDYKLTPLSEVERFIKDNGHLPGIPSAQEVKENGLSLGEMNKNLMEKVEELTLYVIKLQKEVDSLKEK